MTIQEQLQSIKKQFYAYRNGIVADALRRGGDPHHYIMGCQLTDIATIAAGLEPTEQLAQALWNDTQHRECRLLAPMLYPLDSLTASTALGWAEGVQCNEEADVLCHKLLRRAPFANQLVCELLKQNAPQVRYTAFRLLLNLQVIGRAEITPQLKLIVENEQADASRSLKPVLDSILEDL